MVETLRYSLRNKKTIQIIYHGSGGITQRKIKVLKIDDEKITAYCYSKHGIRTFKIELILGASIIHENDEF